MNVGVLGGGQLGRMLALEGIPLGLDFRFLEAKESPPVARLGDLVRAEYGEAEALERFGRGLDVVTYEFENVPVASARFLNDSAPVHPAPGALEMAQDRLVEKEGFRSLGVPTAEYRSVDSLEELEAAVEDLGIPAVLKTRRFGYDGKGQRVLVDPDDVKPAWEALGGRPLLLEKMVDFRRELSILGVRSRDGETEFYPLVENHHPEGILRLSLAPAPVVTEELQSLAEDYAHRIMEHLGYVGVLALELFQRGDELLANEMAPRVHNSGHWTLDGSPCSQFENHLRAVCGFPLGSTRARGHSAMLNFLGAVPDIRELLALPGVHVHLYDKKPRPNRKLGHVNVAGRDPGEVRGVLEMVEKIVESATA